MFLWGNVKVIDAGLTKIAAEPPGREGRAEGILNPSFDGSNQSSRDIFGIVNVGLFISFLVSVSKDWQPAASWRGTLYSG